jgi:periplasmic divalent cation tolerance protein
MDNSAEAIVVIMTAASQEEAGRIAEMLISSRLAACVQILPEIESVYRWRGEVTREKEILLLAKTTQSRFAEFESKVRAVHSYETPEIVAVSVVAVSAPYLQWLLSAVKENS